MIAVTSFSKFPYDLLDAFLCNEYQPVRRKYSSEEPAEYKSPDDDNSYINKTHVYDCRHRSKEPGRRLYDDDEIRRYISQDRGQAHAENNVEGLMITKLQSAVEPVHKQI